MKRIHFILIGMALFIAACSTTTHIIGAWEAPDYTPPKDDFKKIAVVALSHNESSKMLFEQVFVERLQYLGYEAMYGSKILIPSIVKKENKEMLEKMMKDNGVDGVLVLSLLQVKDGVRYVPGTGAYAPGAYYGGWYGYYSYNYYNYYSDPGYYESTTSLYLEANFYDLTKAPSSDSAAYDGKLVSSIQTETVDPMDIEDLADSFSYTILTKLISQGILKNKSKDKK